MNKLNALKIAAAALVVGAAVFIVYRPATVAPESEGSAEAHSSVSKGVAEAVNAPGKVLMAAYPPPDYDRPATIASSPITPQTQGVTEVRVGTTSFLVFGKDIYGLGGGEDGWNKIAEFPVPDGSLFKKYRPKTEMWSYETEIGQSTGSARGIWAGNSFYSGEGFNGIGGVVFYDVNTRKFGVLRHPALVDCSAGALSVSDESLVVRTSWQGEGGSTVCNGVVAIDLKTLKAVSYIPKESQVIRDSDPAPGAKLLGDKYNAPLEKVLSGGGGFEKKDAPNWSDGERAKILAEGLVPYMVRIAREEAEAGAAAEAARPKDVRSDHMWIDNSRAARESMRAQQEEASAAGTGDIDEKAAADVFAGSGKHESLKAYDGLQVHAQEAGCCANLKEILASAVAISTKLWASQRTDIQLENLRPWPRPKVSVDIGTVAFTKPLHMWELEKPHSSFIGRPDCGKLPIGGFIADGATYYHTLGWSRDKCDGDPGILWKDAKGISHGISFPWAYASNIEAVWCLKNNLVFGLGMWHNRHIREYDAVAIWNLKTGAFNYVPLVIAEMGYVRKWSEVTVGEKGDAVVFKSSSSAFAFWPDEHTSAPLDLSAWKTEPQETEVGEKEAIRMFPEMATKEFMKVYTELTDIRPLRPAPLKLSGKSGSQKFYCVCATAQDPNHLDFDYSLSFGENAKYSRVGCFLMSSTRPTKILKLADVPTRRWRDYTGQCAPGETENEVVLTFSGDTYGDSVLIRKYAVSPDAWTSELISESAGEP